MTTSTTSDPQETGYVDISMRWYFRREEAEALAAEGVDFNEVRRQIRDFVKGVEGIPQAATEGMVVSAPARVLCPDISLYEGQ